MMTDQNRNADQMWTADDWPFRKSDFIVVAVVFILLGVIFS